MKWRAAILSESNKELIELPWDEFRQMIIDLAAREAGLRPRVWTARQRAAMVRVVIEHAFEAADRVIRAATTRIK